MNRCFNALSGCLLASLVLSTGHVSAEALPYTPADGEVWQFDVLLGDRDVGDIEMSFGYSPDGVLTVKSMTKAKIKVAFITLFQMQSDSVEIWDGAHLQKMAFRADLNGEDQWGILERQADGSLFSQGPNGTQQVDGALTHLVGWTTASKGRSRFVRPLENDVITIDMQSAGWQTITADGQMIDAELFNLPADENGNETDIWFDREGRWARSELTTPQAMLVFQRRQVTSD